MRNVWRKEVVTSEFGRAKERGGENGHRVAHQKGAPPGNSDNKSDFRRAGGSPAIQPLQGDAGLCGISIMKLGELA